MYTKIDKPTEAGWYWYRRDGDLMVKWVVASSLGDLWVMTHPGSLANIRLLIDYADGQWYGPKLEEPDAEQG